MNKKYIAILLLLVISNFSSAQCPMCKMSAESNYKNGDDKAVGLNTGILYLLAMPFLIGGGVAYVMWKKNKEDKLLLKREREEIMYN